MTKIFCFILFLMVLIGCSSSEKTIQQNTDEPDYTLLYVIHGDADYTYHVNSNQLQADEEVLKHAERVARSAKHGEIIIFHQKPERKRFLFFPRKDRTWYHYKGGELIEKGNYSPQNGGLAEEADLFSKKRSDRSRRQIMAYFGHEIPSDSSLIYHQSQPNQPFDIEIFARDISLFDDTFDMIMLSTCNNGNPYMANSLMGKSDFLVASPRNLHLSHLNSEALNLLEKESDISTKALADSVAQHSFNRLSNTVQTMVTVGVYDLNKMSDSLSGYAKMYEEYLRTYNQKTLFRDNVDCTSLDIFAEDNIPETGTRLLFKAAAFGREANLEGHSPWGCKKFD